MKGSIARHGAFEEIAATLRFFTRRADDARDRALTMRPMSSNIRALLSMSLLTLALGGCYGNYLTRPGTLPVASGHVAPDQRVALWQRAIGVLLDQGYVPQVLNEAACFISAKQRDDLSPGTTTGAIAIVTVTPDGVVRVQVSGAGVYQSQSDLDADLTKRQNDLLAAILAAPPPPKS